MSNIYIILILLVSITIHEFSHALAAYLLGDHTAKHEGRLTLNPLAHLDPIGTLAFFLLHFGWGKPVPVNEDNLKSGQFGYVLVSFAGPFSNFFLAFLAALPLRYYIWQGIIPESNLISILDITLFINLTLFIFNMLPIPPLDGFSIFSAIFSKYLKFYEKEKIYSAGIGILIILIGLSYINIDVFGFVFSKLLPPLRYLVFSIP